MDSTDLPLPSPLADGNSLTRSADRPGNPVPACHGRDDLVVRRGIIALAVPVSVLLTLKLVDMVGQDGVALALVSSPAAARPRGSSSIPSRDASVIAPSFASGADAPGSSPADSLEPAPFRRSGSRPRCGRSSCCVCLVEIFIGLQMSVTGALMVDQSPPPDAGRSRERLDLSWPRGRS